MKVQRENAWSFEIYILMDFTPLKVGTVIAFQSPITIFVRFESFVRNISDGGKEQLNKEIRQMLVLRGIVK